MEKIEDYLNWCKLNNKDPNDEKSLKEFREPKKIKLKDCLKDYLEIELSEDDAKLMKQTVKEILKWLDFIGELFK